MIKKILIFLFSLLLITGCSANSNNNITVHRPDDLSVDTISVSEVKQIIDDLDDDSITIIDVRTPGEYKKGHIKGAINLPLDNIENIDISMENKIIVYCQSGRRSNLAAIELIKLGYENVYDMGGIIDWPYDIVK